MPKKMKVFRTAIGFHDAYVAAPSRKAALAAWGSDKDLFARGMAEEVTDAALAAPALAAPGSVIRQSRGTAAEQMAALPERAASREKPARARQIDPPTMPKPAPRPRPDRAPLEAAEGALEDAKQRHRDALAAIKAREAELALERRSVERADRSEIARLEDERDRSAERYAREMKTWRG